MIIKRRFPELKNGRKKGEKGDYNTILFWQASINWPF